jgi:hypothetical protein
MHATPTRNISLIRTRPFIGTVDDYQHNQIGFTHKQISVRSGHRDSNPDNLTIYGFSCLSLYTMLDPNHKSLL